MSKFGRRLARHAGGALFVTILVTGIAAYVVRSGSGDQWSDGLGRPLQPATGIARWVFGNDEWAGWTWFAVDFVVFFGGMALAAKLFSQGSAEDKAP